MKIKLWISIVDNYFIFTYEKTIVLLILSLLLGKIKENGNSRKTYSNL